MEVYDNFKYLNETILENLSRDDKNYMEISKEIARDVQSKKITILDVIRKLECLLLSQSFSKRDVGVLLLGETLHSIDSGILSPEQLSVLSSYFCEKLKDHHQVATSALRGILALVTYTNTPSESVIQLVSSIFNHIACQQQQQQHRYLIFQIFEIVLKQHTNVVNSMEIDFVYGVISSIDGERDPKNLIYLFNWLQTFLKTVKLGHLTEEMFEVLSCYFPVDFKAPPSDKNTITREDLAQGLCKCLTCIPDFGEHCIPLVLEKLGSALRIAKEDSLDILKAGCKNYKTEIYYQHSIEIWSQIQKEVFNLSDTELKTKCLETLKEVIRKLSLGDQKNFENMVFDIADTLKGNILPDSKLFSQSAQILLCVARSSQVSSVLIAKKVSPLLENVFKITTNPKQKAVILRTFLEFVRAVIETNTQVDLSSLEQVANSPALCLEAIIDKEHDLLIEGHRGFCVIAQFIPENVRQTYLHILHEMLVTPLESDVKHVILKSLEKIAETFPKEVETYVLHKEALSNIASIDNYLEGLSNIVKFPQFENYVIDTCLDYMIKDVKSSTVALKHLHDILSKFPHIHGILVEKMFVPRLFDFLVELSFQEEEFLCYVAAVLQNIFRHQDIPFQKSTYLEHSPRRFESESIYIAAISGMIVPLQAGVFEDYDKIDYLLGHSINASNKLVANISVETLANVINKLNNEAVLEAKLNSIRKSCDSCSNETKVWLISWIAKSLVSRNHPTAWQWADLLIACLQENREAARGFKIIMDDSYKAISRQNYCQIMYLYKQKFFLYCTNKLNEISRNYSEAHLNAVGYLIEYAPRQAVVSHFKKILRLILLCLEESSEPKVLEIILLKLKDLVGGNESVIIDNLEDILLRVLELTKFDGAMTVRLAAVRCLHQFTVTYKVYQLLPYKQKVIQTLGMCVDDRKRLVRREAMECRALWYLLDAPE